jgi:NosR/NirI family transcriptional regulator, nitrous oxide reductase regulator
MCRTVHIAKQFFPRGGYLWVALLAACMLFSASASASGEADRQALAKSIFPIATRIGAMEMDPPSSAVFQRGRVIGYLFFTQDVVASKGFSGKPFNIALGIDLDGKIAGAKIIEQHEPILVIGVSAEDLDDFVAQYKGRDIREPVRVVRRIRNGGEVDAVSGATISSVVLSDAIMRSAKAVGRTRGVLEAAAIDFDSFEVFDWSALVDNGSIASRHIEFAQVKSDLASKKASLFPEGVPEPSPQATISDLYIALATPAKIGRNILGDLAYNRILGSLDEGDQLIFIASNGQYSFKGNRYNRSGFFDRFQIVQGDLTLQIETDDYFRANELKIQSPPQLRESAIFVIKKDSGFDPAKPWRFDLAVQGSRQDGSEATALYSVEYQLPDLFHSSNGTPRTLMGYSIEGMLWVEIWQDRMVDVVLLIFALGVLTVILFMQDTIVQNARTHNSLRLGFLIFTTGWLGWYAGAQLSVLNVLTFAEALRTGFEWEFFLLEPLVFILWGFVALTLLFWGRGVYCGWLCPFGAMQELVAKIAKALNLPQFQVPFVIHERLWPLKYVIFLLLFAVALGDMMLAQSLAEIEPFKTAVVLHFIRDWRYVLYALILLSISLFVERAFCRYLCPLGAALAIPARLRMFEWLRRRHICGSQCALCAGACPVQAIHPDGHINPNECVQCLKCQVKYFDDQVCPPLVQQRKRREKLAASPPPDLSRLDTIASKVSGGKGK